MRATRTTEKPPALVAQSLPGATLQKGHFRVSGLIGSESGDFRLDPFRQNNSTSQEKVCHSE
jgi:hypothetical protein